MRIILTILTAALITAGSPSLALQVDGHSVSAWTVEHVPYPELATQQGSGMTLDQAVEQVRRQYNGRIVSAETVVSGGRETHIIKVLTSDGTVRTVRIPGRQV